MISESEVSTYRMKGFVVLLAAVVAIATADSENGCPGHCSPPVFELLCSNGFYNCTYTNETCALCYSYGCEDGWYGETCESKCSDLCRLGYCEQDSGACINKIRLNSRLVDTEKIESSRQEGHLDPVFWTFVSLILAIGGGLTVFLYIYFFKLCRDACRNKRITSVEIFPPSQKYVSVELN